MDDIRAVVTGASRGLGAALTEILASRGAHIFAVSKNGPRLEKRISGWKAKGYKVDGYASDVADKSAAIPIASTANEVLGSVNLVVHCAATLGSVPLARLLDTDCEDLERALAVNVVGPFRLTKHLMRAMILQGGGTVVHVTSDAATSAYPTWGPYGASKAAHDHLQRTWAAEVPGLRFLNFDPGEMDTDMHRAAVPDADRSALRTPSDAAAELIALIEQSRSA